MDQGQLDFARTHSRRTDPATSRLAAGSAAAISEDHRQRIYSALLYAGTPLTAEQIADHSGGALTGVQVGKRMHELREAGLAEVADESGRTRAGRKCQRYRLRKIGGGA